MTDKIDDGEPAFPSQPVGSAGLPLHEGFDGMSLRDWFAGQALVGIMSDSGMRPDNLAEFAHMAARLFQVADAMIAARKK